ncbi:hypothetical protein Emtol_0320 (plasmid) [Emticicia oligotrophica DSM 17448]|uniref:DUF4134 domain-containing protein n=1 Tax=Emticicia oligotrophica (strain DSM 17448 / CIP 109782 / MTCC 6937 / GPTSA100-15) TaxID=929562 RepID=A0ABN4ASG5_EMTOG|nr:DUF4134 family protein [Emticicia oligotrophica]AFK05587.1 hypothetical protein Emtol_0320 [Emticicia oligotrophica DSM 17448]
MLCNRLILQISGPLNNLGNSLLVDAKTAKMIAIMLGAAYGVWGLYKIYIAWNNGDNDVYQKLIRWLFSLLFLETIMFLIISSILN